MRACSVVATVALPAALACAACAQASSGAAAAPEPTARASSATILEGRADAVLGQPSLDVGTPPTVVSVATVLAPAGLAISPGSVASDDLLWVAEWGGNRVRECYAVVPTPVDLHGQPSWNDDAPNAGNDDPVPSGLDHPQAVTASRSTSEWAVADTNNHRVVRGTEGLAPRLVYGQHGSFTTRVRNDGGISQTSLAEPKGVALVDGFLWVADAGNHRVLTFNFGSTYAAGVFGQPSFVVGDENGGLPAPTEATLSDPRGLAVERPATYPTRYTVWIADTGNHRVLRVDWGTLRTTAVLGQSLPGAREPGTSASSLRGPTAVAPDGLGGVWVADTGNHRVVHFARGAVQADRVLGQPDFGSRVEPTAAGPSVMKGPSGVAVGSDGAVYVADTGFHRVLRFAFACTEDAQCDDGDACTDDTCTGTACSHDVKYTSRACAPYACNSSTRTCRSDCTTDYDCATGYACRYDGEASRCVRTCTEDAGCAGVAGRPFCADGYCCSARCDGTCEACDAPAGECRPVFGRPRNGKRCEGDADCSGVCDGIGTLRCAAVKRGTPCGVEGCVEGVEIAGGACNGAGTCLARARSCGAYACAPGGCRASCASDHDCAEGAYCEAGACAFGAAARGGGCATTGESGAIEPTLAIAPAAIALLGVARRARRRTKRMVRTVERAH